MRAGLYSRVSTDEQARKGYGLAAQLHELRALATQHGYTVAEHHVFKDDGYSGATLDRPALERLREAARGKALDVLLVHDPDRLSRKLAHQLLLLDEIERCGVRVEFLTMPREDSPEGRLFLNMRASIAEWEREKIKQRTARGKRQKARQGKVPSAPAPLGYIRDATSACGLAIDPEGARWAKLIFRWAIEGASIRAIRRRLAAQGCPTPRGGPWSYSTVRRLLSCEHYIGKAWYDRKARGSTTCRDRTEWIAVPVPAIIDEAMYRKAQESLRRHKMHKRGRPARFVYLAGGGFLTCGACARKLRSDVEHGDRLVYRCAGRPDTAERDGRPPCGFRILARTVDDALWGYVEGLVHDPRLADSKAKQTRLGLDAPWVNAQTDLGELELACRRVAVKRRRLRELYVDGRIDRAAFEADDGPFAAEEDRLQTERSRVAALVASDQAEADQQAAVVAFCRRAAGTLDGLDARGRQAFVRQIMTGVVVRPDGLDVHGAVDLGPLPIDPPGGKMSIASPRRQTRRACSHPAQRGPAWPRRRGAGIRKRPPAERARVLRGWRPPRPGSGRRAPRSPRPPPRPERRGAAGSRAGRPPGKPRRESGTPPRGGGGWRARLPAARVG
jgi:site-specific DNA recombinase